MQFSVATIAAYAALLSSASAHMIMKTPYPFGPGSLTKDPLHADGSDFPCKQRPGVYDPPSQENKYSIGEDITLSFTGSAVHGGGSCQISLTSDKKPDVNSKWKVIHSIEGGCPANTEGNLPDGTNEASQFKFQIPDSIKPGEYTLAWTWLNRVGNREFYMNCAPITVQGASKKRYMPLSAQKETSTPITKRDDLPEMFIANINGCMTKEGIDVRYPDPGSSVEFAGKPQRLMKVGETVCSPNPHGPGVLAGNGQTPIAGGGGGGGSSGGSSPSPSASPSPAGSPTPAESPAGTPAQSPTYTPVESPAGSPTPTSPGAGGIFAPTPDSGSGSSSTPAFTPASTPDSGSSAPSGSCTDGQFNCIGGTSFSQCANGQWSAVLQMANGMRCEPGTSTTLTMRAARAARRHAHAHLVQIGH
ncbi:Chitin-binding, domain 3 [Ascosphaera apis ARSEF 7405]|uniref:Chitin-binding, domain 3 n=1 Tax=Ascosphaera apis ARSEF 7405 TaxID=392613 RepID=A0A167Y8L2_9EURO|nr:Chitin-binding, domain 3 [Ascosphaera apis ARSEF 7405]